MYVFGRAVRVDEVEKEVAWAAHAEQGYGYCSEVEILYLRRPIDLSILAIRRIVYCCEDCYGDLSFTGTFEPH